MNDMLSYLLTYKLKGEDLVRDCGIPATIIRPCALTEEPAGAPMIVAQGDNIKGKISRFVRGCLRPRVCLLTCVCSYVCCSRVLLEGDARVFCSRVLLACVLLECIA